MLEQHKIVLSASQEDYLEAIWNLSQDDQTVRSTDIAELLEVAKPSVTGALRALSKKGLVNYKPYGQVSLTEAGQTQARRIARKHEVIESFFVDVLGVEKGEAQQAACQAEHALGPDIIKRLVNFMEFVSQEGKDGQSIRQKFDVFCRKKAK